MKFFRFNKKGVSPLIATVLLIAFAVSLGAVVMNWGRGYVETTMDQVEVQSAEKISCSMDTSMGVVQVGNKAKLCLDTSGTNVSINFTLINTGSVDLEGVQITGILESGQPFETSVKANPSIMKSKLFWNSSVLPVLSADNGTIEQIEIAPLILVKGVQTVCLEHAIKRLPSEIGTC